MSIQPNTIRTQCSDCGGTGLYSGFMEAKGEAVVCVRCGGSGCRTINYTPFQGRKRRNGITKVRYGSGLILDNPGKDAWMTYDEFKTKVKAG
jgi:hypothetical protein